MDPQILTFVQTVGLPGALLIGLLLGLYKLGKLLMMQAVLPMAEAHIKFLNVASVNMEKISAAQDALHAKLDNLKCTCRPQP